MKHTPGEWKVRFFNEDDPAIGFFIEAPNNNRPEMGYGIEIMMEDFGDHNGYPLEQRLADAHLITAAPKMLAFLKELSEDDLDRVSGGVKESALKLIKQAKGEK